MEWSFVIDVCRVAIVCACECVRVLALSRALSLVGLRLSTPACRGRRRRYFEDSLKRSCVTYSLRPFDAAAASVKI